MSFEETKEYLSRYYYLYQKVDSLKEELKHLEILADGTQGCSYDEPRVQKSPSLKAPFIKYIDRITKKEKEIEEKVEELFKLRGEIENAIASIEDSTLELVLTYRYLNVFDWRDVASKLGYALSHVYRLHRQGIMAIKLPQ